MVGPSWASILGGSPWAVWRFVQLFLLPSTLSSFVRVWGLRPSFHGFSFRELLSFSAPFYSF